MLCSSDDCLPLFSFDCCVKQSGAWLQEHKPDPPQPISQQDPKPPSTPFWDRFAPAVIAATATVSVALIDKLLP